MKRNKISLLMFAATLTLVGCNYNEQFEGLDKVTQPKDIRSLEYTLTAEDYSTLSGLSANKTIAGEEHAVALAAVKSNQALSATISADKYVPAFLNRLLPVVDNGSVVKVTYNLQNDQPAYMTHIAAGKVYTLKTADYETVWGKNAGINYFTPSTPATAKLPAMLAAMYDKAVENDVVMVNFSQSTQEPAGTVVAVNENFSQFTATDYNARVEGWTNIITIGTYFWSGRYFATETNGYIQQSAFNHQAGELESYMVTPKFVALKNMKLTFDAAYRNYRAAGGRVSVLVSENFVAGTDSLSNVNAAKTATWVDITDKFTWKYPNAENGSLSLANVGEYNLSDYAGKQINIAFRYNGHKDNKTSTAQIDNVLIKFEGETNAGSVPALAVNDIYKFNGTAWARYSENNLRVLQLADFVEMGGRYDNFSTSMNPDNYLPTFLRAKYPYAQNNQTVALAYKYYANPATSIRIDEYKFTAGEWVKNNAQEQMTDQFLKSDNKWVFNPSVVLNLAPVRNEPIAMKYYQAATDWVWENIDVLELGFTTKGQGYVDRRGNAEFYAGCSAYYNNIDMRPASAKGQYPAGYADKSDAEIKALMEERLIMVMGKVLEKLHSDAVPIEGIDITYTFNVGIYTGSQVTEPTHTFAYKVVGPGQFEYIKNSFQPL